MLWVIDDILWRKNTIYVICFIDASWFTNRPQRFSRSFVSPATVTNYAIRGDCWKQVYNVDHRCISIPIHRTIWTLCGESLRCPPSCIGVAHLSGTSNDCVKVGVVSGVSTGNPSTSGRDSLVDPSGVSIDNRVSFGGKNRVLISTLSPYPCFLWTPGYCSKNWTCWCGRNINVAVGEVLNVLVRCAGTFSWWNGTLFGIGEHCWWIRWKACVCVILVIDNSCHKYGQDGDGTGIYIS